MTVVGGGFGLMTASEMDLLAVERAAVRGWPALETKCLACWLLRYASGGSVRANSVAALEDPPMDMDDPAFDQAVAAVEMFYRERAAIPRFTITDVSRPIGLDARLGARGWVRCGEHVTMAKGVASWPVSGSIEVIRHDAPTSAWYRVYLGGLTEDRRHIAPQLVERVPEPRAFFSALNDGEVVASGMSVLDGALASVQCMATLPAARRTGAAKAVLAAIEAYAIENGARHLYLQADLDNAAAMGLYAGIGFRVVGRYHTRELHP